MIYMFTLIRTGKDSKDRDKDYFLCIYNISTMGDFRKENGSIYSLQFLLKCSPPLYYCSKVTYNKFVFILTVPLSILFFLCSQNFCFYSHTYRQHSRLLSMYNVHHIVSFKFHHVATQILVTAPNL